MFNNLEDFIETITTRFSKPRRNLLNEGIVKEDLVDSFVDLATYSTENKEFVESALNQTIYYANQVEGAALSAKTQSPARFSNLIQYIKQRVVVVWHGGTSIEKDEGSGTKQFFAELARLGDSGNRTDSLGLLGGSNINVYSGWKKQPYGGFGFVRSRGDSGSSAISFKFYMKRYLLRYSKEANGGSFDIYVDDVFNQTVNCNGAQSYANEIVITWANAQYRKIEFRAPATGFAYIESHDYCLDNPGIHFIDISLGGSAVGTMFNPPAATGAQVAGIAVLGNNGLDSLFNNLSTYSRPDLIVDGWCVNDAGQGLSYFNTLYKPAKDRIISLTKASGIQVLFIIEMGGHFSLPIDPFHSTFISIRNLLLSYRNYDHVTVIDWHGKSGMATSDNAELERLANKYYAVTSLNAAAGTYGGDFIHPIAIARTILTEMLLVESGITPQGRAGNTYLQTLEYSFLSTPLVDNLPSLSADSYRNIPGITRQKSNSIGLAPSQFRNIGVSRLAVIDYPEPLWYGSDEINYGNEINDYIAAGLEEDTDLFGRFKTMSNYSSALGIPSTSSTRAVQYTVTIIIGPGAFTISLLNQAGNAHLPQTVKGVVRMPTAGLVGTNLRNTPQAYHFPISAYGASNMRVALTGKIYAVYVTPTDFACIPGRNIATVRNLTPIQTLVSDITTGKVIISQLYHEVLGAPQSKTVEKICIGKDVFKPLSATSDKFFGLFRLQNRTEVDIRTLLLTGAVTNGAFDDKFGGVLQTTTANPAFLQSSGTFDNTYAGKIYTLTGFLPLDSGVQADFRVNLYTSSNGHYIGLNLDGSWTDYAVNAFGGPTLLSAGGHFRGKTISITFTFPDSATFDARTYFFRVYNSGPQFGKWVLCEGSSATV